MKDPKQLTDEEITEELTWCRQQLEALDYIRCRQIVHRQTDLWDEWDRREIAKRWLGRHDTKTNEGR